MLPVRRWPDAAGTLARTFGVRGAALRTGHELRRAADWFRRAPRETVARDAIHDDRTFRVDAARLRAAVDLAAAIERAERVVAGEHHAYRWTWTPLPATADAWLRHPLTGHRYAAEAPWWTIPHLSAAAGDIKDAWEPARFGWVYDLVRASLVTDDPRYTAAFVATFATWRESSPPFLGPHWSCGQETAIRAIALLYAEANLPLGPEVAHALLDVLAASGERIDDALGYAISQRNNHALSEAVALLAIGARLHGAHPDADRWVSRGRRWLVRLISEQFAPDGWYVQHSFTYMRLALDQCVIGERVLRALGDHLPAAAAKRLRAAATLLLAVVEPTSGEVPNHGANDGAFVHPITTAGYRDFCPVITAVCAMWDVPLPENVAADPEVLAWLSLPAPTAALPLADGVQSGASGWAAARAGTTQVFLRAGHYTSRPSHVDPLHVDVRFGPRAVIVDAGTFVYNAPPPWRNALVAAHVHNGPLLDGREPGVRGPRFLWYAWPDAQLTSAEWMDDGATIVAERAGRVRRTVRVEPGAVRIEDHIAPGAADEVAVRWLLHPDAPTESICVDPAPGMTQLHAATEGAVEGWYSPAYGVREPSRVLTIRRSARAGATIVTTVRPGETSDCPCTGTPTTDDDRPE